MYFFRDLLAALLAATLAWVAVKSDNSSPPEPAGVHDAAHEPSRIYGYPEPSG